MSLQDSTREEFLGMAGDYVFFLSLDNSKTYIVKLGDLHYFEFPQ
jgi:hypothetical protein